MLSKEAPYLACEDKVWIAYHESNFLITHFHSSVECNNVSYQISFRVGLKYYRPNIIAFPTSLAPYFTPCFTPEAARWNQDGGLINNSMYLHADNYAKIFLAEQSL